jgi:DUF971 family protein
VSAAAASPPPAPWPVELRLNTSERRLHVTFDDGASFALPAELLRVYSPSAEVQGHGGQGAVVVAGKAGVGIVSIDPVGNYAVRIAFDDGHRTGLYTWAYLYALGACGPEKWAQYEAALSASGLRREA